MQELVNIVQNFRIQEQHTHKAKGSKPETQSAVSNQNTATFTPLPESKLAINISDKDWTDFLSSPSILGPTTTNVAATLPNDLFFSFNFGG